jgi:hypothetical protein
MPKVAIRMTPQLWIEAVEGGKYKSLSDCKKGFHRLDWSEDVKKEALEIATAYFNGDNVSDRRRSAFIKMGPASAPAPAPASTKKAAAPVKKVAKPEKAAAPKKEKKAASSASKLKKPPLRVTRSMDVLDDAQVVWGNRFRKTTGFIQSVQALNLPQAKLDGIGLEDHYDELIRLSNQLRGEYREYEKETRTPGQ